MSTFNKFLVILLALASIVFWLTVVFIVWTLPGELALALRDTAVLIRGSQLLFQGLITAFGVSSVLVALLILAGEFSSQEPSVAIISQVTGGSAVISLDAIAQRLKSELEELPQIRMVRPRIRNLRKAIDVRLEVRTDPETHLPTKADEVCRVVRQITEDRLGVRLKDVRVNIQPDAHERPSATTPTPPAAPVATGEILVPGSSGTTEPTSES